MSLEQLRHRYDQHYASLLDGARPAVAERVVGGDFEAVGALEFYALKAHGLQPDHLVVDVGCGTGRLACQLVRRGHQRYVGFDLVPAAVDYARNLCGRPDWRFAACDGLQIDVPDEQADFVCFFSVFTHIAHEHTYLYFREARRVLKSGGLVVFSFLEFSIATHWAQFDAAVQGFGTNSEPIVFLDRTAIRGFAMRLGFEVLAIVDGDVPTFPIDEDIVASDGRRMQGRGYLGQSLAVLRKL